MPCASWTLPTPLSISMRSDRSCEQQEADCRSPGWRECCTGSNTRDLIGCSNIWRGWPLAIPVQPSRRTSPICRSVKRTCSTQPTSRQAHWLGQRGKRQQAGRRSTPQRRWHALGSAERRSHAGAAQCGLQSRVEADLGDGGGAATSVRHPASASKEPAPARQCPWVPRRVGSTGLSAVSSPCCCFLYTDGCCQQREAISSSSWFWLFLAQTVSQASFFDPYCYRRDLCKKMKRTRHVLPDCTKNMTMVYYRK